MDKLVKAARIIDGTGAEPLEKGAILISGNTIKSIGGQNELKVESGTQTIDAGDKTIIPGLIDCHGHLCSGYRKWTYDKLVPQDITKSVLRGVVNAQRCIRTGVLTLRDAGCTHIGIFEVRTAINSGQILGPRLLVSGLPITPTGGHDWNNAQEIDGPDSARRAARDMLGHWGADCLKFMVTGGAGTQHMELTQVLMTANELAAAVGEARTRGKRTLAHATNPQGVLQCVEAGVDSIDHGNVLDNAALDAMKKAGSFYTPTIYVYYALATTGAKAGGSEWAVQKAKGIVDSHKDAFQKAYRMGINIATGTDLGSVSTDRVGLLGEGLFSEIELMVKYGMAPMDAIKSATHTSARNLGVEKVVGTLQKDKLADLVIIDGNPLEDIQNLRRVWQVMKEGEVAYEA